VYEVTLTDNFQYHGHASSAVDRENPGLVKSKTIELMFAASLLNIEY
jgi:hypothetical protein